MRGKRKYENKYILYLVIGCLVIGLLLLGGRAGMQRAEADVTVTPFPVNSIYGEKAADSGVAVGGDADSFIHGTDGGSGETQSTDRQITEAQNSSESHESVQNGYGANGGASVTPFPVQITTNSREQADAEGGYRFEEGADGQAEDKPAEDSDSHTQDDSATDKTTVQSAGNKETGHDTGKSNVQTAAGGGTGTAGIQEADGKENGTSGTSHINGENENKSKREHTNGKDSRTEGSDGKSSTGTERENEKSGGREKVEEQKKKEEKDVKGKKQEEERKEKEEYAQTERGTKAGKPEGEHVVAADPFLEELNGSWRTGVTEDLAIMEYSTETLRKKDLQTEILCDGMDVEDGNASCTGTYRPDGTWKYRRTVPASAFAKDGFYVVRFLADDQRQVAKEVRFYVDRTLPEILYADKTGRRLVTDPSVNVHFVAFDSMGLRRIAVEADGSEICQYSFSGKTVKNQYELCYKMQRRADRPVQRIRLVVTDQAGNRCVSEEYEFIWWRVWIRRRLAPIGVIGVICLLLFMIIRKRVLLKNKTLKNKIVQN